VSVGGRVSVKVANSWRSLGLGVGTEVRGPTGRQGWWGSWRHSCPEGVGPRKANLSVELAGGVKRSSTVLPTREAERSRTG